MKLITISLFAAIGVGLCFATPDPEPGIVDRAVGGVVNGMVGGVVNELAETAGQLLNFGGRGGLGDRGGLGGLGERGGLGIGGRSHLLNNLPLKDVIMRVRNLLGVHPVRGTEYCSCPQEENFYKYQRNGGYNGGMNGDMMGMGPQTFE